MANYQQHSLSFRSDIVRICSKSLHCIRKADKVAHKLCKILDMKINKKLNSADSADRNYRNEEENILLLRKAIECFSSR
jgi:hypothetical protein